MGNGDVAINEPGIDVHNLGYIEDPRHKSLAYAAADALLHPAPVDNLPNVVLEALAHGTPAIAMPVGGLPELVRPGVSGWLADEANPASLGAAVDRALHDDLSRDSCRHLIETEYSLQLQGEHYIRLFRSDT
jgi:glycosyltransferase involved in cell wall biosynthesis